jgi:DNA polymerase sigma
MIVRNKIWDEIVHADANAICARKYANVQRRIQLFYLISVPLLSAVCVVLTKLQLYNETVWTALFIFVSSLIKAVFPRIVLPEKDILELDKLFQDFSAYYGKLEDLWFRYEKKVISEEDAEKEVVAIGKSNVKKKKALNKLVLWIPKYIDNRITKESEQHLNPIFNNKYE